MCATLDRFKGPVRHLLGFLYVDDLGQLSLANQQLRHIVEDFVRYSHTSLISFDVDTRNFDSRPAQRATRRSR